MVSELDLSLEIMTETRAKAILKETVMKETEEAFDSRCAVMEDLVADQNKKMEKKMAELLEAIRLLAAPNASSSGAQKLDRSSPMCVSTPEKAYPSSDRENLMKSESSNGYAGLIRLGKDDFPRFDGDKIREWLFKVEEFFEVAGTPNGLKVGLASAHFDGHAAKWHQSLVQTGQFGHLLTDWSAYKVLLKEKFENVFEDPIAELKQLQETEGIVAYHEKFELIMTRVNLPEEYLVSVYLDGLQIDTQINVRMFQPQTVSQCLLIGRLYEKAHPKMVSNQSWSGSKWNGNGNQLKGILDCEEDQLSRDDNELVNIEVPTSADLLLSKERDSPPKIAIGCELEAGETDTSIDQNQLIQEDAKNQSTDSFHETSLLHHKNSLLKHQVSISHWEFSHRSSIECLDVYDDWPSTIVRTHQSQSNIDLEYAAINAYQVCDSMSLGTKLLTNGRRKTFLKTWRFKFKNRWTQEEPGVIRFLIRRHLYLNFDCEAPELAGRKRNHGLLFRLRSKQKQRKCPKCWMFKFRKRKIDQRLGYDVIDTYLENKKTWTKWRVRKHDNLSWKEDASDKSWSRSSRGMVEVDIKEDDQKQQGDLGHSSLIIAVANRSHLWSTSYHVWHRWKARVFVEMISTMRSWLSKEGGFDIGNEEYVEVVS